MDLTVEDRARDRNAFKPGWYRQSDAFSTALHWVFRTPRRSEAPLLKSGTCCAVVCLSGATHTCQPEFPHSSADRASSTPCESSGGRGSQAYKRARGSQPDPGAVDDSQDAAMACPNGSRTWSITNSSISCSERALNWPNRSTKDASCSMLPYWRTVK